MSEQRNNKHTSIV